MRNSVAPPGVIAVHRGLRWSLSGTWLLFVLKLQSCCRESGGSVVNQAQTIQLFSLTEVILMNLGSTILLGVESCGCETTTLDLLDGLSHQTLDVQVGDKT